MDILEIERMIITRFRPKLYAPFIRALQEFDMIKAGDKVGVCISGGKDSLLLAKLFQELHRHSDFPFSLEFIVMDPGFNKENLENLKHNLEYLQIPAHILQSDVFSVARKMGGQKPCYLCARMRRGFLYQAAKDLGCNKIALGHHFDDVVETIMINMLYGAQYNTMMPKLKSTNFSGMELIRPLYFIKEKDIIAWMKASEFTSMNCGCSVASGEISGKRKEIKELIKELKLKFSDVDMNIFRSAENVNLNCCISWKKGTEKFNFLTEYENGNVLDE